MGYDFGIDIQDVGYEFTFNIEDSTVFTPEVIRQMQGYSVVDAEITRKMYEENKVNFTAYGRHDETCTPETYVDRVPRYQVLELRERSVEAIARMLKAESWTITPPKVKKQTKKEIKKGVPYRYTKLKVTYIKGDLELTVKNGEYVVVDEENTPHVFSYELFHALFERKVMR